MPPVEGRPPQLGMDDLLQREADTKSGKHLLDYLNGLDETGPPPPYYEGTRAGNLKHIIEDANSVSSKTSTDVKENVDHGPRR